MRKILFFPRDINCRGIFFHEIRFAQEIDIYHGVSNVLCGPAFLIRYERSIGATQRTIANPVEGCVIEVRDNPEPDNIFRIGIGAKCPGEIHFFYLANGNTVFFEQHAKHHQQ